ncbi:hypothetical protein ABPG75_008209 [Micractinium tetrahymenae]
MSVRFTLVDRQLKLFKFGLQSLQKIGSELLLEALPARVVLRTINSSLSAYLSVTYNAAFFDSYDVLDCNVVQAGLLMKHVLSVFRTQRVAKILFDLSTTDCRATVTLHCENGLVKSYKLPTMDSEILQATVDKQQFAVRLSAEAPAISRLLSSFHAGLEEVTLVALPEGAHRPVHVNSFIDPQKGHVDKSLYTSVQVEPSETFLSFVNSADEATDVTFNLKDFKAMLSLCENLGTHVRLWFDSPGNPLVAEPSFPAGAHAQDADYEAELILSTLMESHAGAAAAAAAAAAGRVANGGGAAAAAAELRTPGGGGGMVGIDSPAGDGVPSTGRGRPGARAAELGLSPAPGLPGRTFPGATVARPGSAGAAGAAGPAGQSRFAQEARQQSGLQPSAAHPQPEAPGFEPPPQQQQQQQQQQQRSGGAAAAAAAMQQQRQQQQQQQRAQQRPRLSGLIDDGSLWARSDDRSGAGAAGQSELRHPLEGDAGPFHHEQAEVSWEDEAEEAAVPSSPPQALPSALPPGAIM